MLTWSELAAIAVIAAAAAFVWDSLRARESANAAMRRACEAHGLYFLDDTVALASLGAARDVDGRLHMRRVYTFAYSDTGHNRRRGRVALKGTTVEMLELEAVPTSGEAEGASAQAPRSKA